MQCLASGRHRLSCATGRYFNALSTSARHSRWRRVSGAAASIPGRPQQQQQQHHQHLNSFYLSAYTRGSHFARPSYMHDQHQLLRQNFHSFARKTRQDIKSHCVSQFYCFTLNFISSPCRMIVDFLALNDVSTSLADAYVLHFFAARCYASAAYAVSVCVSVCLSVRGFCRHE